MNREIKFRGKRIDNGQWVYGYYFVDLENKLHYIMLNERRNTPEDWMIKSLTVHPGTIGQFTGLKDKDGKEIFEGDILRHEKYNTHGVMEWDKDGSWTRFYPLTQFSVIGNIHDNIDLINKP